MKCVKVLNFELKNVFNIFILFDNQAVNYSAIQLFAKLCEKKSETAFFYQACVLYIYTIIYIYLYKLYIYILYIRLYHIIDKYLIIRQYGNITSVK